MDLVCLNYQNMYCIPDCVQTRNCGLKKKNTSNKCTNGRSIKTLICDHFQYMFSCNVFLGVIQTQLYLVIGLSNFALGFLITS